MDIYTAATKDGGVQQFGEITVINLGDSYGAITVRTAEYSRVLRIAQSEPATFIKARDVRQFADMFETRVSRPGAQIETIGSIESLLRIAQLMQAADLDYGTWHFPLVIKQVMRKRAYAQFDVGSFNAA